MSALKPLETGGRKRYDCPPLASFVANCAVSAGSANFVTAPAAFAGTKGVQAISSGVDLSRNHEDVGDL